LRSYDHGSAGILHASHEAEQVRSTLRLRETDHRNKQQKNKMKPTPHTTS
jgi:hypothetical protein